VATNEITTFVDKKRQPTLMLGDEKVGLKKTYETLFYD